MAPIQIFTESFAAEPWPALTRLRQSGGVHRVMTPDNLPAWLVTRYQDVHDLLLDPRLSTRVSHANPGEYQGFVLPPQLAEHMLNVSPEDHAILRQLVTARISPRQSDTSADRLRQLVSDLFDKSAGQSRLEPVSDLAVTLPALVIGDVLDLPDQVVALLESWASDTIRPGPRARDTLDTMRRIIGAAVSAGPDTPVGRMIKDISPSQAHALVFYLLFVWYEVVVDAIGAGLLVLLDHPERPDPADWQATVEELLRLTSPQMLAGPRFALSDIEIGDARIKPGECVLLSLASANHDETVFDDPDRFVSERTPNPHIALGRGPHACIGAALTRGLLAAFLSVVAERCPNVRLAIARHEIRWETAFRHRGPREVPIEWG